MDSVSPLRRGIKPPNEGMANVMHYALLRQYNFWRYQKCSSYRPEALSTVCSTGGAVLNFAPSANGAPNGPENDTNPWTRVVP